MFGDLAVTVNAMRVYLRSRRELLGYTQETFASALGVPYPTYRDFEGGATKELKAGLFARAVDVLGIPIEHIKKLGNKETTVEEAEQLSKQILSEGSYRRATEIADQVPDIDVAAVVRLIDSLEENPDMLARLRQLLKDSGDGDGSSQQ